VVLAAASTLLAVTAHVVGCAGDVHVTTVLPAAFLIAVLGTRVAGGRRGGAAEHLAVFGVLGPSQIAMHALFVASDRAHDHHVPPVGTAGMIAAHVAAVVCTGLLLVHADTLLNRARAALSTLLPPAQPGPRPDQPATVLPPRLPPARLPALLLSRACPRRGPPRFA